MMWKVWVVPVVFVTRTSTIADSPRWIADWVVRASTLTPRGPALAVPATAIARIRASWVVMTGRTGRLGEWFGPRGTFVLHAGVSKFEQAFCDFAERFRLKAGGL
ncbi:MAG TPA: hypothetical protein VMJ10_36105 [Kofleriaceae bacterium]|nr:hypothetical protein [Kofleriaceae bacterium]